MYEYVQAYEQKILYCIIELNMFMVIQPNSFSATKNVKKINNQKIVNQIFLSLNPYHIGWGGGMSHATLRLVKSA